MTAQLTNIRSKLEFATQTILQVSVNSMLSHSHQHRDRVQLYLIFEL